MNLTNLMSDVKKSVSSRLFNFRKLRYYISEKSAIVIYKQTILPVFDYTGRKELLVEHSMCFTVY